MLLNNNRQLPEDLDFWKEIEYKYRLYYQINQHKLKRKEKKSIELIKLFYDRHKDCYASISWGKDSTLLAYLIYLSGCDIPLIQVVCSTTNPDNELVRDSFLNQFPLRYLEIEGDDSADENSYKQSEITKFFSPLTKRFGEHKLLGIRADESDVRKIQLLKYHGISNNSCHPIIEWKIDDVFAYILRFNLPLHPVYAMTKGGLLDYKTLRVDTIGDIRGATTGRKEWEKLYYPDILELNKND